MGTFVSTFIPYGATGRAVNPDTEYMYRDDADYNWFILPPIDSSNAIKADLYKVCELYIEPPSNACVKNAINDLYKLKGKLFKLDFNLTYGSGDRSELCKMIERAELDLSDIINKLEDRDAK